MNMIDYLKWRGDLTFSASPFNNVDNLILSYLSYVDFRGVMDSEIRISIEDACQKFYQLHSMEEVKANKSFIAMAPIVMLEMSHTNRFKDLMIHDYVNNINNETTEQFSALQIDLPDQNLYVAYCGTDDTLIGWKEDFQLSYKTIHAQTAALEYLNSLKLSASQKIYVGGHSKGGNLALYAAANCKASIKERIIKVFDNDGPSISEKFVSKENIASIQPLTLRIIPEFSVFGMIFDNNQWNTITIASSEKLVMEHDATSWQILGTDFVKVENVSAESIMIKNALDSFLNETTNQQKASFIDAFFDAIFNAGIHNMSEFPSIGLNGFIKLIRNIMDLNEDVKAVGIRLLKVINEVSGAEVERFQNSASEFFKNKMDDVGSYVELKKQDFDRLSKEAKEKINNVETEIIEKKNKILKLADKSKQQLESSSNKKSKES